MTKVVIKRVVSTKHGTFGVLLLNDNPICVTLEETWLDNMPTESCIPAGAYRTRAYSGTKYKNVWQVHDVPGRSAILIHWGNTEKNTAGCILVGQYFEKFGDVFGVANSVATIGKLRDLLPADFILYIDDCF